MTMTCGAPARATYFEYNGTVAAGVEILFPTATANVSAGFLDAITSTFAGREIRGGFSMDNPPPGGLGAWVKENSAKLNGVALTPRHASFIAAILRDAGLLTVRLDGNTVYLRFP